MLFVSEIVLVARRLSVLISYSNTMVEWIVSGLWWKATKIEPKIILLQKLGLLFSVRLADSGIFKLINISLHCIKDYEAEFC